MNLTELESSIKRYIQLYYDVSIDENDEYFSRKMIRLFQENSDSTLEEYWQEYIELKDAENTKATSRIHVISKNNLFRKAVAAKKNQMLKSA